MIQLYYYLLIILYRSLCNYYSQASQSNFKEMGKRKNYFLLSRRQKRRRLSSKSSINSFIVSNKSDAEEINILTHNQSSTDVDDQDFGDNIYNLVNAPIVDSTLNPAIPYDSSSVIGSEAQSSGSEIGFLCDESVDDDNSYVKTADHQACHSCSEVFLSLLKNWANSEKKVSNNALERLLASSQDFIKGCPKTAVALKQDYYTANIERMGEGEYVHFHDWYENLVKYVLSISNNSNSNNTNEQLTLALNVDGIPLGNNTKHSAYPILLKIMEYPKKIFTAGVFCTSSFGCSLPSPSILLQNFLTDLKNIPAYLSTNDLPFSIKLGPIICDAPMRAFIKCIKGHTGYNACERCTVKGTLVCGHIYLLDLEAPNRTDNSFNEKADEGHHQPGVTSPLVLELNFPTVSNVVLDYMHLCTVGVQKKILLRLQASKSSDIKKCHLSTHQKGIFEDRLKKISRHVPTDFPRKLERGFKNVSRWKSTEYRLFMLYAGIVIFNDEAIVRKEFYSTFLLFAISMRLLLSDEQEANLNVIRLMLSKFVRESAALFGKNFLSYNVHSLIHLPDDYERFGNLENISAYPFENFLGNDIKGCLRAGYKPLSQIAKHVNKINKNVDDPVAIEYPIGKILINCEHEKEYYKKLSMKNTMLSIGRSPGRDNCILLVDRNIAIIQTIAKNKMTGVFSLGIRRYTYTAKLFNYPMPSDDLGIMVVDKLCDQQDIINLDSIEAKVALLPFKSMFVGIVLLHSLAKN